MQAQSKPYPPSRATKIRQSRRAAIEAFFLQHLGERSSTTTLHERFGSAFRTRVSEINRNRASAICILNKTNVAKGALGQPCEHSIYWAELRASAAEPAKPDTLKPATEYIRDTHSEKARTMLFAVTEERQ